MRFPNALMLVLAASPLAAQRPTLSDAVRQYVAIDSPTIVFSHVRVIDGTGPPPNEHQAVVVRNGKIASVTSAPAALEVHGVSVIDASGKTLIPGLVMVHEHMFYPTPGPPGMYSEMAFSFPRLYLAAGITTARTGGSMHPYAD